MVWLNENSNLVRSRSGFVKRGCQRRLVGAALRGRPRVFFDVKFSTATPGFSAFSALRHYQRDIVVLLPRAELPNVFDNRSEQVL